MTRRISEELKYSGHLLHTCRSRFKRTPKFIPCVDSFPKNNGLQIVSQVKSTRVETGPKALSPIHRSRQKMLYVSSATNRSFISLNTKQIWFVGLFIVHLNVCLMFHVLPERMPEMVVRRILINQRRCLCYN